MFIPNFIQKCTLQDYHECIKSKFNLIGHIARFPFEAEEALLVASRESGQILAYDDQTGDDLDVFIEEGSGGLKAPSSLTYGPNDEYLYISDYENSSVLRFDEVTGEFVDTFIPPNGGGLISPETIAFGPDDDLFIAGLDGNGIRRYDGDTGKFIDNVVAVNPTTQEPLNTPNFAFDSDNDLYISSVFPSGGVLKYDWETDTTTTFISPEDAPTIPGGLALGADNLLYVGDFSEEGASVLRYDLESGELVDEFVKPGSGGLSQASRLVFGPEDDLYVTSFGSDSVLRFDGETGNFVDEFVTSGSRGLDEPIGLLFTETSI
jgi:sugar lactone lactonase YvrE